MAKSQHKYLRQENEVSPNQKAQVQIVILNSRIEREQTVKG